MGEGKHFADAGRQVFTLWINNLACFFSPDFIAAFTSACVLRARVRAAMPPRPIGTLIIASSFSARFLSRCLPSSDRH